MKIDSSHIPGSAGSLEEMIGRIAEQLGDQSQDARKLRDASEASRHQAALRAIEDKREAAHVHLVTACVSSGLQAAGTAMSSEGQASTEALRSVVQAGGSSISSDLDLQAEQVREKANQLEHVRAQHDDARAGASKYQDKALSHLGELQRLVHESRMQILRG